MDGKLKLRLQQSFKLKKYIKHQKKNENLQREKKI